MKRLAKVGTVLVLVAAVSAPACSDDEDNGNNGGPDAGSETEGGDGSGGSGGSSSGTGGSSSGTGGSSGGPATMCGGEACEVSGGGMFLSVCCTEDEACGIETPLVDGCIAVDQPGGFDPTCEGFDVMGFTLPGCCGPDGCGAFIGDTCASNQQLGLEAVECDYDPNNTCTGLLEVPCDGAEDCPSGQQCCGRVDGTTYTSFGCFDSCAAAGADAGMNTLYLELCHEGDTCTDSTYTCGTSEYLPEYLMRCYETAGTPSGTLSEAADEINCGTETCGSGEKCCMRPPKEPYCAPAGEDCTCTPAGELPEGGTEGGAPEAGAEAGTPDAATDGGPTDAATTD